MWLIEKMAALMVYKKVSMLVMLGQLDGVYVSLYVGIIDGIFVAGT